MRRPVLWIWLGLVFQHLHGPSAWFKLSKTGVSGQDVYDIDEPEPWYIRRGHHHAFAVKDLDAMEKRLKHFEIEVRCNTSLEAIYSDQILTQYKCLL